MADGGGSEDALARAAAAAPAAEPGAETEAERNLRRVEDDVQSFLRGEFRKVVEHARQNAGAPLPPRIPLARVRRVMRTDGSVRMIAVEAPAVFAKACELFIGELTIRAFHVAQQRQRAHRRGTVTKADILDVVHSLGIYDFLREILRPDADAALADADAEADAETDEPPGADDDEEEDEEEDDAEDEEDGGGEE